MELPVNYNALTWTQKRKVREQYFKEQNGLCMWCNEPLDSSPPESITSKPLDMNLFPKYFLDYPVHLQHCHNTGMTEGVVHAYCNGVMWQYHNR